jgi:hypothetical protein
LSAARIDSPGRVLSAVGEILAPARRVRAIRSFRRRTTAAGPRRNRLCGALKIMIGRRGERVAENPQKERIMLKRRYLRYLPPAVAAFGVAGFLGAHSFADDRGTGLGGHDRWDRWMLQEMDSNKDGKVTQAEIAAFEAARAAEIDTDKDGKITAAELQAFHEKERARHEAEWLARMDTNGDGAVSVDEFKAAQTWRLAKMDRNGDGTLDEQDMRDGGPMHHRHHPWPDDGSAE